MVANAADCDQEHLLDADEIEAALEHVSRPSARAHLETLVAKLRGGDTAPSSDEVVEEVINPDWEVWEREKIFPGKKVFKKFGDAGLLGIHKPTEYGGQGLSYKYHVAFLEALGNCKRSLSFSNVLIN